MVNPIAGPGGLEPIGPITGGQGPGQVADGKDFKQVLLDSLNEVNRLQQEADQSVKALYSGETDNVAEVFTAVNKAGVAFDLLMEIRNKLVDAYQEINRIRI